MSTESLVVSIPQLAKLLGVSRNLCYSLARQNRLPVSVIFIGNRRMVVSRQSVKALLEAGKELGAEVRNG